MNLVDSCLIKKTTTWAIEQEHLTVTLDIGMEYGIPLLAVLFINGGKSKLVDIVPLTSKKGIDVADACYEACKLSGQLNSELLREKIVGITGDGAFAKGNAPFKDRMFEHLGKTVIVRWDPLHLINRAHIEARGVLSGDILDLDDNDACEEEEEAMEEGQTHERCMLKELIDYIQNQAKKMRTGIEYSKMKEISMGMFRRPKVWSSTRMVVYEFDMVERFLENAMYLDIPAKFLLLAQCHCLSMFELKIVLKNVQSIAVSTDYIESVILNEKGKHAMLLGTRVAYDLFSRRETDYLSNDTIIEGTNISHPNNPMAFSKVLLKYVKDKNDFFINIEKPHDKNTRGPAFSIDDAKDACDRYITMLWNGIKKRVAMTDFSDSPCAFSEAPAESIFSTYARVTEGKESLSISNSVALTRIACHGPPVATPDSKALSEEALEAYESLYGARFCSHMWFKGASSKVVKKIHSKKWNW